jgi:hypothetical protein
MSQEDRHHDAVISRLRESDEVTVDGALAVAYGLTRMRGRKLDSGDVDLWFRTTAQL